MDDLHYYILDHFVLYYGMTYAITYLVISFFNTGRPSLLHTLSFCPLILDNLRYYILDHFIL